MEMLDICVLCKLSFSGLKCSKCMCQPMDCRHAGGRLTTVAVVDDVSQTEAILAAAAGRAQGSGLRLWPLAQLRPGPPPPTRQQLHEAGVHDGTRQGMGHRDDISHGCFACCLRAVIPLCESLLSQWLHYEVLMYGGSILQHYVHAGEVLLPLNLLEYDTQFDVAIRRAIGPAVIALSDAMVGCRGSLQSTMSDL